MTILHIDSAITGDDSASRALSAAIVARLVAQTPGTEVVRRDVAADPLPHFTFDAAETRVLDEYLAADTVVIGAPLYNFGIASQLKACIDRILVAGRTSSYTAEGPVGLATHIRVIIAVTRGGLYAEGRSKRSSEHAETYLTAIFDFLGIVPEFVIAEGLKVSPEQRATALAQANARITTL